MSLANVSPSSAAAYAFHLASSSDQLPIVGKSSTPESSSVDASFMFPSATDESGPPTQVSGVIEGVVVFAVVTVLVVGSVTVAASLIAWKVRSGKTSKCKQQSIYICTLFYMVLCSYCFADV